MSHLKICGVNKSDVALRSLALLSSSSAFGGNVLSLLLLPFHGKTSGFCLHFWLEPRLSRVLGGNTVQNHAVSHVREEGVELCVSFNPPSCQNFFNDCRDSEKRQARHANRSNMNLQALHIGSARAIQQVEAHRDFRPGRFGVERRNQCQVELLSVRASRFLGLFVVQFQRHRRCTHELGVDEARQTGIKPMPSHEGIVECGFIAMGQPLGM